MSDRDPIEDALQRLRPAQMEPSLMARLTAARPHQDAAAKKSAWRGVLLRWLLPVATSAGVAVATFSVLEHQRKDSPGNTAPKPTAIAENPTPVESHDYLVSAQPVGIVVAPNQKPYRIMDVQWLEYQTVRAAGGGPEFHTATTRRDVIPVALELY